MAPGRLLLCWWCSEFRCFAFRNNQYSATLKESVWLLCHASYIAESLCWLMLLTTETLILALPLIIKRNATSMIHCQDVKNSYVKKHCISHLPQFNCKCVRFDCKCVRTKIVVPSNKTIPYPYFAPYLPIGRENNEFSQWYHHREARFQIPELGGGMYNIRGYFEGRRV